jgi:hypothetical protein
VYLLKGKEKSIFIAFDEKVIEFNYILCVISKLFKDVIFCTVGRGLWCCFVLVFRCIWKNGYIHSFNNILRQIVQTKFWQNLVFSNSIFIRYFITSLLVTETAQMTCNTIFCACRCHVIILLNCSSGTGTWSWNLSNKRKPQTLPHIFFCIFFLTQNLKPLKKFYSRRERAWTKTNFRSFIKTKLRTPLLNRMFKCSINEKYLWFDYKQPGGIMSSFDNQ